MSATHKISREGRAEHAAPPGATEIPLSAPPPSAAEVVPHPAADFGGLNNISEELLTLDERVQDELDHAGLDQELPGEDRAPVPPQSEAAPAPADRHAAPAKWAAPSP